MNEAERWCSPDAKSSNKSLNCQLQDDDVMTLNVPSSKRFEPIKAERRYGGIYIDPSKYDFRTEEQKRKEEDENDKQNINYKHKTYAAGLAVNAYRKDSPYNRKPLMYGTETQELPKHPPPILVDNVPSVLKSNHF